jgi:hypothetical protein
MAKLDSKLLKKAGLDSARIAMHAERIRAALAGETQTTIPVESACTVENGGVVAWDALEAWVADTASREGENFFADAHRYWAENHLVTAVPAAGAASRFLGELQKFVTEAESKSSLLKSIFESRELKPFSQAEREALLGALASVQMNAKMAGLHHKIEEQEFEDVRSEYRRVRSLLDARVFGKAISKEKKGSKKQLPSSKMDAESAADMRTHWGMAYPSDDAMDEGCCGGGCGGGGGCGSGGCGGCGSEKADVLDAYACARAILNLYNGVAKLHVPTTVEGDSFLRLKLVEQISLAPSAGNVLIVPAGQIPVTSKTLKNEGAYLTQNYTNVYELAGTPFAPKWLGSPSPVSGSWKVMEQGAGLSTIRFDMNAEPVVDKGDYSLVAAGHGELVHLFKDIATAFPKAECLHVRNIDNVVGASGDVTLQFAELTDAFRLLRDAVEYLRAELGAFLKSTDSRKSGRIDNLDLCLALDFVGALVPAGITEAALSLAFDADENFVGVPAECAYDLLGALFHWNPRVPHLSGRALWVEVDKLLSRPLSVFGVVKKEDGDVGGGPVYIRLPDGSRAKLCMEMPHANEEDSKKYFANKGACTHFNPVLTFFELRTHSLGRGGKASSGRAVDFRRLFDDRFWMLSRKEFKGQPVCYHETVLYELIGNSATTNLVFIEVPRSLFCPHKTIFESLGRDRESYGFAEVLGKRQRGFKAGVP